MPLYLRDLRRLRAIFDACKLVLLDLGREYRDSVRTLKSVQGGDEGRLAGEKIIDLRVQHYLHRDLRLRRLTVGRSAAAPGRGRCSALLAGSSIDIPPMADFDHQNLRRGIIDRVNDAVGPDADAVELRRPRELFAPVGARLESERSDALDQPLPAPPLPHGLKLLGRARLDEDSIACHAA